MPSPPNQIAVIFDCDDTLAKDTTVWILEKLGANQSEIFRESNQLISKGWDPSLAWLNIILRESREGGSLEDFSITKLHELANDCNGLFFEGTEDLFDRLKASVDSDQRYEELRIQVNPYILTGGLEEFVIETPVGKKADVVWGSSFEYDDNGKPFAIKNSMTFTEKTRYLFCINKGVAKNARTIPYSVNAHEEDFENRNVPFRNMIYIGDGPSDIPCMSVITRFKGYVIGILGERLRQAWELGYGRRANVTIHPEYGEDERGYRFLETAVKKIADNIVKRWEFEQPSFPSYGNGR